MDAPNPAEIKLTDPVAAPAATEEGVPLDADTHAAAVQIQKTYRGYRDRRALQGLSASQRWTDALREARFRQAIKPIAKDVQHFQNTKADPTDEAKVAAEAAEVNEENRPTSAGGVKTIGRQRWNKVSVLAKRLQAEDADESSSSDSDSSSDDEETRARKRKERQERKRKHVETSRAMGLMYWLEAIDVKHRYGSNLQSYHAYWQNNSNDPNFFHWLDYGEGRELDLIDCPREKLDKERVRYLSREERMAYLVKVDDKGRLCWARNGELIDTSEKYRDSVEGIVPIDSPAAPYVPPSGEAAHSRFHGFDTSSSSSSSSSDSEDTERADRYVNKDLQDKKAHKKVFHVSPAVVLNHLLRKTTRKNTWIFVADISFRLYIGIKQSGAFQHSSFLNGQRVAAAGLIRIKDGVLQSLSPLSGHYRPPSATFRRFLKSLKEAGVDISHLKISKSYAVLVGIEAYTSVVKAPQRLRSRKERKKSEEKMAAVAAAAVTTTTGGTTTTMTTTTMTTTTITKDDKEKEKHKENEEESLGSRFMKKLGIHRKSVSSGGEAKGT